MNLTMTKERWTTLMMTTTSFKNTEWYFSRSSCTSIVPNGTSAERWCCSNWTNFCHWGWYSTNGSLSEKLKNWKSENFWISNLKKIKIHRSKIYHILLTLFHIPILVYGRNHTKKLQPYMKHTVTPVEKVSLVTCRLLCRIYMKTSHFVYFLYNYIPEQQNIDRKLSPYWFIVHVR